MAPEINDYLPIGTCTAGILRYGKNQPHSLHQKNVMQVYQFVNFTEVKKNGGNLVIFLFQILQLK